jgi:predicted nucleic acid-binding protein
MIILDTNIVSELMRPTPSAAVVSWLDRQSSVLLHVTTITVAEICYGLSVLPKGNRKNALLLAFEQAVEEAFRGRILPFDQKAAREYGELMGNRKKIGRPLSILDGQIASIARANSASLATRNVKDFSGCMLLVINPFEQKAS